MKRTFLVEIEEQSDSTIGITDIGHALTILRTDKCRVTETTAVHAKEREVIEAAIAQLVACEKNDRWIESTTTTEYLARELRALMEGKA